MQGIRAADTGRRKKRERHIVPGFPLGHGLFYKSEAAGTGGRIESRLQKAAAPGLPSAGLPSGDAIFLPYQRRWLGDSAPVKLWEKARRIGATYTQAYEDVMDCVLGRVPAVWYTSSDETAAKEYMLYCWEWARLLNILNSNPVIGDKGAAVHSIEFGNGARIGALSSNPKQFRSKGGKVILDEFAHHERAEELWEAARPCVTWGYPLRILSTHNGENSMFYRFLEAVTKAQLNWSRHRTDIHDAVGEGLLDKIRRRRTTAGERREWLEELRADCVDESTWQQEYCCQPVDESVVFISYELIRSVEMPSLYKSIEGLHKKDLFLGMDVGRKKDLSVIWLIERQGERCCTRAVRVMERMPFAEQRAILYEYLSHPSLRRACIDASGLGMQLAEEAKKLYGEYKVEAVNFTAPLKESLAYGLKKRFEQRTVFIPEDVKIREDLHSVKKIVTAAGNVRFDVASGAKPDGNADRFWALALAVHAAAEFKAPFRVTSRGRGEAGVITAGYWS
ncbi:MAG: hypothetical protein IH874_03950 [Candidatus Dadabacteria bacterium]|nr:hypothetical protein [Candidatus Dadabacteria bacterium]